MINGTSVYLSVSWSKMQPFEENKVFQNNSKATIILGFLFDFKKKKDGVLFLSQCDSIFLILKHNLSTQIDFWNLEQSCEKNRNIFSTFDPVA